MRSATVLAQNHFNLPLIEQHVLNMRMQKADGAVPETAVKIEEYDDYNMNQGRTLWERHKSTHPPAARGRPEIGSRVFGSWGAAWFFFTVLGTFYYGTQIVLPRVYEGFADIVLLCHTAFAYFVFAEMMVNWFCVRLVSNQFDPGTGRKETDTLKPRQITSISAQGGTTSDAIDVPNGHVNTETLDVTKKGASRDDDSSPGKRRTVYMVSVASNGECGKREVFPYWDWKPCLICQKTCPPRAHHCPLCKQCILKRDHHCYFTGSCIGLRNQRYFIVFNFWASIATSYSLLHAFVFTFQDFLPNASYLDLFLPATFLRWIAGYTSFEKVVMVTVLYSLLWFCPTSTCFFWDQMNIINKGITTFESDNKLKIANSNTREENIRGVFGDKWLMNFFIPTHVLYESKDDGIHWPTIKVG